VLLRDIIERRIQMSPELPSIPVSRSRLSNGYSSVSLLVRRYTTSGIREGERERERERMLHPTYAFLSSVSPCPVNLPSLLSLSFWRFSLGGGVFRRTIETNRLIRSNVCRLRRLSSKDTIGHLYLPRRSPVFPLSSLRGRSNLIVKQLDFYARVRRMGIRGRNSTG